MTLPSTTRAIVITRAGEPDVLELRDTPLAPPAGDEVTVEIRAAGVNPVDAKIRRGLRGEIGEPRRIGDDGAGIVLAAGPDAAFAPGDLVAGWRLGGAYAEHLTVSSRQLTRLPDAVSFAQGAAIGIPAATAYQCLRAAGLEPGETLLVHAGAGAVGQAAIQFARLWGAEVIATASSANHERLQQLGATPVLYGDGLLDRIREAAPHGIDRVLEGAGTLEAIDASLQLVGDPQRIVEIVVPDWAATHGVQVFSGGLPGSMTPEVVALRAEAIPYTVGLMAEGRFSVELAEPLALGRAAEAHRRIETTHPRGKIILTP